MGKITLKEIRLQSDYYESLEEVFVEAFPPEETIISFKDFINYSEKNEILKCMAILDEEKVVGFTVYAQNEVWCYVLMIAIKREYRGSGYGESFTQAFLKMIGDRVFFGAIENPQIEAGNSSFRKRRAEFYKRQGIYMSDITLSANGVDYVMVSTNINAPLNDYFNEYMDVVGNPLLNSAQG